MKTKKQSRILFIALGLVIALPALSFGLSQLLPATATREITIDAQLDQVWEVLSDLESFRSGIPPSHLSVVKRCWEHRGVYKRGGGFVDKLYSDHPRGGTRRELRWLGHVAFPGLMDGNHSFVLEPADENTKVTQSESFTGILGMFAPLFMDLGASFEASNKALANFVESKEQ
ncbi:hypothetical protein KaCgl_00010 [Corynebacterium glutamicum]|uniref:SRPBCC family protein n=1 Tax=Corynebacterium glutamicum TaxID=1718 RepID=UPI0014644F8C|nr:SRPBCC family protein [Corynebacterium glutamicum]BCB32027.1 hypothetical protein KaCgl_00010 [Corynebacterium glutamicum]